MVSKLGSNFLTCNLASVPFSFSHGITGRAFCVQAVAERAQVPKVLSATGDLGAALVQNAALVAQSVAALVQNAAVPARNAVVADQNVVVPVQNVGAEDLTAVADHYAPVVHNAAAFPRVAVAPSGRVVAHNCAQVDPDVARKARCAPGVRVARGDQFQPVAGSVPGVPAVHFVPADRFSRAVPDVPQESRFPMLAVWWEQLTVVALAANR